MTRPFALLTALCFPLCAHAQDAQDDPDPFGLNDPDPIVGAKDGATAELAERTKPSLVVVTQKGRDGQEVGTGSGFVVNKDGLIATCAHVIGEARAISVRFPDGSEHEVTEIHAWDRKLDLAVLRIAKKPLTPLPLAKPDSVKQGTEVIAMGNPLGFEFSVVRGVVSGLRDVEQLSLIQIAIPIEPGNSGGPLLDSEGNVHGMLTMKSAVTDNLGFATPVGALHKLLADPNPIPMEKWLTIGRLDPNRWKSVMGARWKQRAGRITVEDPGSGFGGRSLCISQQDIPELPYEVAVEVKLDDEAGAAGLIFSADGGDVHYGFYPSAGNLRLTRFEGPEVFSWTILKQLKVEAYQPGEWNRIRVRVDKESITGFVNGEQVLKIEDKVLREGKAGLAKFRSTQAEFRRFRIGKDLTLATADAATLVKLEQQIEQLTKENQRSTITSLTEHPQLARRLLLDKVKELRATAEQLETASDKLHRRSVARQLSEELAKDAPDLAHGALILASLDNTELDASAYLEELDRMGREISKSLTTEASAADRVAAIASYLFTDNGYHGSRSDYYNRSNSYLNEVIDDREGIPITLSLLFIELGERVGVKLHGLGLPGHFAVFYEDDGQRKIIDAFEGGTPMSTEDADALASSFGDAAKAADYEPSDAKAFLQRMIYNLKGIAIAEEDFKDAVRYVDLLLAIDPKDAEERLSRALLHVQMKDGDGAKPDLEWLFRNEPEGMNLDRLRDLYEQL